MVPKGGLEPPRVTSHAPQTCASTSSATSARSEGLSNKQRQGKQTVCSEQVTVAILGIKIKSVPTPACYFFFVGAGEGVNTVEVGTATGAAVEGAACGVAAGVAVGVGIDSPIPDCKTELVPLINGSDKQRAISMKAAAAPMVIFASSVCVPRGPKAVLETELENNAPASALPGCNNTATTKTIQARMNSP